MNWMILGHSYFLLLLSHLASTVSPAQDFASYLLPIRATQNAPALCPSQQLHVTTVLHPTPPSSVTRKVGSTKKPLRSSLHSSSSAQTGTETGGAWPMRGWSLAVDDSQGSTTCLFPPVRHEFEVSLSPWHAQAGEVWLPDRLTLFHLHAYASPILRL